MPNNLPIERKAQIIQMLVEGSSMRAISRVTGASINTVTKLLVDAGTACQMFHDEKVVNVPVKRLQADEIWAFCYAKAKNVPDGMEHVAGDVWTFTGIDPESKLMVGWLVGDRTSECAKLFFHDIKKRITGRIQLTTDSLPAYKYAAFEVFGRPHIDYAQIHKIYESQQTEIRYSPAICVGFQVHTLAGRPKRKHICTSHVERQNLNIRMHIRRFTRLTNAFSKKVENHCHALALYFAYYNWCKIHTTLGVTPAMQAGLIDRPLTVQEIAKLTEIYKRED